MALCDEWVYSLKFRGVDDFDGGYRPGTKLHWVGTRAMPMSGVVQANGLVKRYGETVALSDVSVTVSTGEVFVLVGPNGAGKTTLVRALTGTIEPEDGSIAILDGPVSQTDPSRIGLLPQSFDPHGRLTVRELLLYYAGLYDQSRDVSAVIADVGLEDASETRYENLSGGQQRRVCVGSALINDPEVLFLDEPTTGIDPAGRRSVWSLLEGLSEDGTTIFLTTHDMAEAAELGDRVGLLDDGQLIEKGSPETLIEEYGGKSVLRVDTEEHLSAAEIQEFGESVVKIPTGFQFRGVQPSDIGPLVENLDEMAIRYDAIQWTEPTLEDAYLQLTGNEPIERAPRNEGSERYHEA